MLRDAIATSMRELVLQMVMHVPGVHMLQLPLSMHEIVNAHATTEALLIYITMSLSSPYRPSYIAEPSEKPSTSPPFFCFKTLEDPKGVNKATGSTPSTFRRSKPKDIHFIYDFARVSGTRSRIRKFPFGFLWLEEDA